MKKIILTLFLLSMLSCKELGTNEAHYFGGSGGCEDGIIHKVKIKNFSYQPSSSNVRVGDCVEFTNIDLAEHNVVPTENSPAKFKKSPNLKVNESFTLVIEEPENIKGMCSIHPGMPGFEIIIIN